MNNNDLFFLESLSASINDTKEYIKIELNGFYPDDSENETKAKFVVPIENFCELINTFMTIKDKIEKMGIPLNFDNDEEKHYD